MITLTGREIIINLENHDMRNSKDIRFTLFVSGNVFMFVLVMRHE